MKRPFVGQRVRLCLPDGRRPMATVTDVPDDPGNHMMIVLADDENSRRSVPLINLVDDDDGLHPPWKLGQRVRLMVSLGDLVSVGKEGVTVPWNFREVLSGGEIRVLLDHTIGSVVIQRTNLRLIDPPKPPDESRETQAPTTRCCPRCGFPLEVVRAFDAPDSPMVPSMVVRCKTCGESAIGIDVDRALEALELRLEILTADNSREHPTSRGLIVIDMLLRRFLLSGEAEGKHARPIRMDARRALAWISHVFAHHTEDPPKSASITDEACRWARHVVSRMSEDQRQSLMGHAIRTIDGDSTESPRTVDLWEAVYDIEGETTDIRRIRTLLLPSGLTPAEAWTTILARSDAPETARAVRRLSLTLVHHLLELPR